MAAARASGDADALLAALNARHVALWHPDGLAERFGVADEMIALAAAHDRPEARAAGPQLARGRPVGGRATSAGFEAELERHEALADALRLPTFRWYAPMWRGCARGASAATTRRPGALIAEALAIGARAGDGNVELCAEMLELQIAIQEHASRTTTSRSWRSGSPTRPAGPRLPQLARVGARRAGPGRGGARRPRRGSPRTAAARLPFDFNWLSGGRRDAPRRSRSLGDAGARRRRSTRSRCPTRTGRSSPAARSAARARCTTTSGGSPRPLGAPCDGHAATSRSGARGAGADRARARGSVQDAGAAGRRARRRRATRPGRHARRADAQAEADGARPSTA